MGLFSSSKTVTVPATGYYAQPKNYRDLHENLRNSALNIFYPDGTINSEMFTPLAKTADETQAFERMRTGLTPTAQTLGSDISMLMNPYDEYVVNDLNNQSRGDYSLARQYAGSVGQMGSNRDMLGASDVEQNRLNSIGTFRQSQYNQALDSVFNNLIPQRQNDINNLLGMGGFDRTLDTQTKQAPYNALTAGLDTIPSMYIEGTPEQQVKVKSTNALGSLFKAAAPIIGTAIGGPIGGAIGGAVGSAATGGGVAGALQGALGGDMGGSSPVNGSLMDWGGDVGQWLGSMGSSSPVGPYQSPTASFFR